jgi:two-component system response regulator YesN
VAAHVLLSPSYFSVVFGREVGETFIEYLTNVRIRKAIELLHATSLTSSEIAYRVGYHNPRYFYSVFRKVTGLPPNEFRRRT